MIQEIFNNWIIFSAYKVSVKNFDNVISSSVERKTTGPDGLCETFNQLVQLYNYHYLSLDSWINCCDKVQDFLNYM